MKKDEFCKAIKKNLLESKFNKEDFGYLGNENYFTNEIFKSFINDMETKYHNAYKKFNDGKGGELDTYSYKNQLMPPKMASVASSSRFCYLALRDGLKKRDKLNYSGTVDFEHECKISITDITGTAPQLDAFIECINEDVYFETKCQEIFNSHYIKMSKQYKKILETEFGLSVQEEKDNKIIISRGCFAIDDTTRQRLMFDIKQLLCHLLGIASENKKRNKSATLVYMFFKPKSTKFHDQIDETFKILQDQISHIFMSDPIKKFCNKHKISLRAIAVCSNVMKSINEPDVEIEELF